MKENVCLVDFNEEKPFLTYFTRFLVYSDLASKIEGISAMSVLLKLLSKKLRRKFNLNVKMMTLSELKMGVLKIKIK